VLNLATGLVSPQYHLRFDNYFETMQDKANRPDIQWLYKAHFKGDDLESSDRPSTAPTAGICKSLTRSSPTSSVIPAPARVPEEIQGRAQQSGQSPTSIPPNEGAPSQPTVQPSVPTTQPVQDITPTPLPLQQTRSGRTVKPTARSVESQQQRQAGIVSYHVEFEAIDPLLYQEEDQLSAMDDPIKFIATHDQPIAQSHQ
jgi:hypothetical protein